jgi:hypothetical protein
VVHLLLNAQPYKKNRSVSNNVPDPGSGAFLSQGSGMGKKSRSGSGIWIRDNIPVIIPDIIFESLETIFGVKNT